MRRYLRLAVLALATAPFLSAQVPKPALQVQTASGQTTFRIGERIALELAFTGPPGDTYSINTASYDHSGRLSVDDFNITPSSGWSDPLATYFSSGIFSMGGLRGTDPLSSEPVVLHADLNEYVRFDQPGTYTLVVTSRRAGRSSRNVFPTGPPLSILSNSIELHIVPATPEWQAAVLQRSLNALAAPQKPFQPQPEQQAAIADLRFLGAAGAIDVLASNLRDDRSGLEWPSAFGLVGTPAALRDDAVRALRRRLDDPDFPISNFFITILSVLHRSNASSSQQAAAENAALFHDAWLQALAALPRKVGTARAASAEALLVNSGPEFSPEDRARAGAILAGSLNDLSPDRQALALQYNFEDLPVATVLPTVRALATQDASANPQKQRSGSREAKSAALARWYQLEPDAARRELLKELHSPNPPLSAYELWFLPAQPLPDLESVWAQALLHSSDSAQQSTLASLLTRFGTGAATPQVTAALDQRDVPLGCMPRAAALAYLVRFDPDGARPRLHAALDPSVPQRDRCTGMLFQQISKLAHGPVLNQAAALALNSTLPEDITDAANFLHSYGTVSARDPLLQRYLVWARGQAALPAPESAAAESGSDMLLGQILGLALLANQGWLASPALTADVMGHCVHPRICEQLKFALMAAAESPLYVSLYRSGSTANYTVAQYATPSIELFEAKIAQFPEGTKFSLIPTSPRNLDQLKLEKEAESIFIKHRMALEVPPRATK